MSNSKEKLFPEFPPVSTQEWKDKIVKDLKGADYDKKLMWKTNEGFTVKPFYRQEDIKDLRILNQLPAEFPYVRSTKMNNNWLIRQEFKVKDFIETNKKAHEAIAKGTQSLCFNIHRYDLSKENIDILLKGIDAESVELNFKTCSRVSGDLVKIITDYLKNNNFNLFKCRGAVDMDFVSPTIRRAVIMDDQLSLMTDAINASKELNFFRVLGVNALQFSNAGAYITQELGYALAWGNDLMVKLIEAGINPTLIAKKIKFNFSVSSNYFMEIAKFRAARWLWAEIVYVHQRKRYEIMNDNKWMWGDLFKDFHPFCKGESCTNYTPEGICCCASKMDICAFPSTFNQTVYDAHVNMLRTQTEAMSAALGGVNSISMLPYDISYHGSSDFSERIARNQQLMLKEESHFDKVIDPAGGSYYIESLTQSIAQEAWKIFVDVQRNGFENMVNDGRIQRAVNQSAEKRFKDLASRKEILLGTNQFPNFTEKTLDKIVAPEYERDCGCGIPDSPNLEFLNEKRLSSAFEDLRLATERATKTPKAFMLTIGNLAMRLARSQFSCNFLACAGYEVIDNLGFETIQAGIEAARNAKADIIVLCSSDDEYASFAPEAYKLTQGKEILVIAGAPACMEELKSKGMEHFIHVRSNVLETLAGFNKKLIN